MPKDAKLVVFLNGSEEMDTCREVLLGRGYDTEDPLMKDLEVQSAWAAKGKFDRPFTLVADEATTAYEALIEKLCKMDIAEQHSSAVRRIVFGALHIPVEAA
jgi:hypothetical protein